MKFHPRKRTAYDIRALDFLEKIGATVTIQWKGCGVMPDWHDHGEHNHFDVLVTRNGKQYGFEFHDSIYNTKRSVFPSAYDVLSCVQVYDVGSIDDFVNEFGYEVNEWSDVKKIEKIYAAVCDEATNINRLFGDVIDEFSEVFQ